MSRLVLCSVFLLVFFQISNSKQIELIIDASGSMQAKLANGQVRIDAAKKAVTDLLNSLPPENEIACRAYGHQSPREQHNCQDTELLTGFGQERSLAIAKVNALKAQGYTPITTVLQLAVEDFTASDEPQTIILVSDGKETCDGDPCALADSLIKSGINLVIHTVGFGVQEAAQAQLECIAAVTGGRYFGAEKYDQLKTVLADAIKTAQVKKTEESGLGKLTVEGADLMGHEVREAATDEKVAVISKVNSTVDLPAGIYNVTIGGAVWKSVQVKAGEETRLRPGWLTMKNPTVRGHDIIDAETWQVHGHVSNTKSSVALMPGPYNVLFGELFWPVVIKAGEETLLNPGTVTVKHASYKGHKIKTRDGIVAARVSNTGNWAPLIPGEYVIELNGENVSFTVAEGEDVVFEAGK